MAKALIPHDKHGTHGELGWGDDLKKPIGHTPPPAATDAIGGGRLAIGGGLLAIGGLLPIGGVAIMGGLVMGALLLATGGLVVVARLLTGGLVIIIGGGLGTTGGLVVVVVVLFVPFAVVVPLMGKHPVRRVLGTNPELHSH